MSDKLRAKAEKAAAWIAEVCGEPAPTVGTNSHGQHPFSVGGLDFAYMGRGWRYDDDPWNERNLSRVEYEEGVHVFLKCPRHGNRRVYPYGTVPWEMPPMAAYSGQVIKCSFCAEPALFNGYVGSHCNGHRLTTPMCAHCAKVRFRIGLESMAKKPLKYPTYTKKDLRAETLAFLQSVRAYNPECHQCVTLSYHSAGNLIDTIPMLRRTYKP